MTNQLAVAICGRRLALGWLLLTGVLAAFAGNADARELKLGHWMSPKHPMHDQVFVPMAAELESISGGKLAIRIYPGGALGKGPNEQLSRAVAGVVDIAFGIPGYTSDQFRHTLLAELPGLSPDTVTATRQLWKAYRPHLEKDFAEVKLLALWTNDASVLIMRDKPVRRLEDLAGQKIRVPSAQAAELVTAWGGVPVSMPSPKIYTSMQTGIIDGVYIGASGISPFKLHEVAKYVTTGLPPTYTTFYLVMNRQAWDNLSPEEQSALEKVSGREVSLRAAEAYGAVGKRGLKLADEAGLEVAGLAPAEAKRFADAAARAVAAIVGDLEAEGIAARAIVAALKSD